MSLHYGLFVCPNRFSSVEKVFVGVFNKVKIIVGDFSNCQNIREISLAALSQVPVESLVPGV